MQNKIILQLLANDIQQIDQLISSMNELGELDSALLQLAQLKVQSLAQSLDVAAKQTSNKQSEKEINVVQPELEISRPTEEKAEEIATTAIATPQKETQTRSETIEQEITTQMEEQEIEAMPSVEIVANEQVENNVEEEERVQEEEIVLQETPLLEVEEEITAPDFSSTLLELEKEPGPITAEMEDVVQFDFPVAAEEMEEHLAIEPKNNEAVVVAEEVATETKPQQNEMATEPEAVQEEIVAVEEQQEEAKTILGEQIKVESKSINDLFVEQKLEENHFRKVETLSGSIGINDKFLFIRELFENHDHFQASIDALDKCLNRKEAIAYMSANFKWTKSEASQKFIEIIKQRFPQ